MGDGGDGPRCGRNLRIGNHLVEVVQHKVLMDEEGVYADLGGVPCRLRGRRPQSSSGPRCATPVEES